MMRIFLLLAMILPFISACTTHVSDGVASLVNGYKIWVMNSKEIYLGAPDDVLLAGQKLEELAVTGGYIVGKCSSEDVTINGFKNTKGYFIIDTKNQTVKTELSKQNVIIELNNLGITKLPPLKVVRDYFTNSS